MVRSPMHGEQQFSFDAFRFDARTGQLWRERCELNLTRRAAEVLHVLVERAPELITKGELFERVWRGNAVSDDALTSCVQELRQTLGDSSRQPRYIETKHRRGYRFIMPVRRTDTAAVTEAVGGHPPPLPDKPSLAVLPFLNLSGDPGQDYFVDGMVEEIVTAVARFPWLFVIARSSSSAYKGTASDVRQVAHELGVRYILEGSVRKAGNRLRVTGQLVDTTSGAHIWADRFDGSLEDVFDLQDQVASRVAGAIEPRLRIAEGERAARKPTDSLDAYDLHLRAQAIASTRTREGLAASIRLARRALELDPRYGPAMARLALSRGMQCRRNWIPSAGPEVEEGIAMARKAIAAAGDDPLVLVYAGQTLALLAGDWDAALFAINRAIEINPNFGFGFGHRAVILSYLGRHDEAIHSARQAIRLSPFDPAVFSFYQALARAELAAGRYEAALSWAEKALLENGGMPAFRLKLSLLGHLGRLEEARACLSRAAEFHCEPTTAGIMRALPKGVVPELAARIIEGLRKAGIPEE